MLLASFFAVIIGILVGLLGGGGSILTVPVLVYLADIPTKIAIIMSLIIVGTTSLIASLNHARQGHVCWKTGFLFGSAGMLGAFLGGRLIDYVPDALLLILLGMVMLAASFSMIFNKKTSASDETKAQNSSICPVELPIVAIVLDGFFLGIITGLVGVGGGFILVPALVHLAGLPVHAAIGTSLFIIVLQSSAALIGNAEHFDIDPVLTLLMTSIAVAGSFLGSKAAHYIPATYLKRSFGFFVLILGSYLLYREINATIIVQVQTLVENNKEFITGASAVILFMVVYRLWLWLHTKTSKI